MKKQTHANILIRSSLALALALAIWSPVKAQAQSAEPAEGKMMTKSKMMEQCQEMKGHKQKMKEDMKAQDAELTNQISKMNSAPQDKKINLMAAVITRMEEQMMQHMMQHMQSGKESMSQCPMMKNMDEKSGDDHKEHQKELK